MSLDPLIFRRQFEQFERQILGESGKPFESFHDGFADEWERYKVALRDIARGRLGFRDWRKRDVGTGRILQSLIQSIEVSEGPDIRNNLVDWQPRYGPKK